MELCKAAFCWALFFVNTYFSSCAKEEVAPEASAEIVAAKKKGERSLEKDVDPNEGCQCYMSVTGTANMGNWSWTLEDVTDPSTANLALAGNVSGWTEQGGSGGYQPYPSPYFPLTPPDAGCHQFLFTLAKEGGINPPENAELYTSVRCYDQEGDLATEVSFIFSLNEVDEVVFQGLAGYFGGYDWRLTSCTYLYQTPGEPDPYDCSPSANDK